MVTPPPDFSQQVHGYSHGHQLIAGEIKLPTADQDAVDRLSDISGPLAPAEKFAPYLTTYPLPSKSHYVVARTWQDLDAPRAGCVLTRSIFVPMRTWEQAPIIHDIVAALTPIDRAHPLTRFTLAHPLDAELPKVRDQRTSELVEALFLEVRQPLLMFETPEAETIALRLLTALWGGLRQNFSVCTMALSQRSIGGKPFDLLFAPKSARTRFSEWTGRRIEANAITPPRHRWTAITADKIFQSARPDLGSLDTLGVLESDRQGDEAVLRLSLLWNELQEMAETSPNAVLGMIDILNARSEGKRIFAPKLMPRIAKAMNLASSTNDTKSAWTFFGSLLGKLSQQRVPLSLLRDICHATQGLTVRDPKAALEFLKTQDDANRNLPRILCCGLGGGFGISVETGGVLQEIYALSPDILLKLLSSSDEFVNLLLTDSSRKEQDSALKRVESALVVPDQSLLSRARDRIIPRLNNANHAPLLGMLLRDVPISTVLWAVSIVGQKTAFQFESFDAYFLRSVRGVESMRLVRNQIAKFPETRLANRFLAATLQMTRNDLHWLFRGKALDEQRAARLAAIVLASADDRTVQDILSDEEMAEALLYSLAHTPLALGRLLTLGSYNSQQTLDLGIVTLPKLDETARQSLAKRMLQALLYDPSSVSHSTGIQALEATALSIPGADVIALATSGRPEAISNNIMLIADAPSSVRTPIVSNIDKLVDRVIRMRGPVPHVDAVKALSKLVIESGKVSRPAQENAAAALVPYALRHREVQVSALLVVAFPIVYAELAKGQSPPSILDFFPFYDWDRCKVAREELADTFMNSEWPPSDLLLTLSAAGILPEVLAYISRRYHGKRYLKVLRQAASKLPAAIQAGIDRAFSSYKDLD